jgi:hypothetical protein
VGREFRATIAVVYSVRRVGTSHSSTARSWIAVALGALLLIAACAPAATPLGTFVTPSRQPPSPTPSIKPATEAEIKATARAFAKALSTYNRAVDAANKRRGTDNSFEIVTAFYRDLAKAEEAFRKALGRIRFPAEIAGKAKILTDAVAAAHESDLRAARARDYGDLANLTIAGSASPELSPACTGLNCSVRGRVDRADLPGIARPRLPRALGVMRLEDGTDEK